MKPREQAQLDIQQLVYMCVTSVRSESFSSDYATKLINKIFDEHEAQIKDKVYSIAGVMFALLLTLTVIYTIPLQLTSVQHEIVKQNHGYYDSKTRDFKLKECK